MHPNLKIMPQTLLLFLFFSLSCYGQSFSKSVIGSAGDTVITEYYTICYTVGEAIVGTFTANDRTYQLAVGYHDSLDLSALSPLNIDSPELQLQIQVFPNPVSESIFITHPTEQFFDVMITDISGKQILKTTHQKQQPLNVQALASGTYLITVTTKDSKQTNTYKIIK